MNNIVQISDTETGLYVEVNAANNFQFEVGAAKADIHLILDFVGDLISYDMDMADEADSPMTAKAPRISRMSLFLKAKKLGIDEDDLMI